MRAKATKIKIIHTHTQTHTNTKGRDNGKDGREEWGKREEKWKNDERSRRCETWILWILLTYFYNNCIFYYLPEIKAKPNRKETGGRSSENKYICIYRYIPDWALRLNRASTSPNHRENHIQLTNEFAFLCYMYICMCSAPFGAANWGP